MNATSSALAILTQSNRGSCSGFPKFSIVGKRMVLMALISVFPSLCCVGQPYAATQAAQPVTTTNATLNGMVTPRGLPTVGWFEWGTDATYGQTTSPVDMGNGTNVIRLSAPVESLLADTLYFSRLVASNSAGTTYGLERRFTTGRRVAAWGFAFLAPIDSILPPANLGNVVSIAAGDYHGVALKADGTIVSWGTFSSANLPATVPAGLSNAIAIAGGRGHSLALQSNGTVVAWGDNSSSGQTNVPPGLSNVVAMSAGDAHSLALKSDGRLSAWGSGPAISIPTGLSNVVAISSGDTHCLALRNNGKVTAWGSMVFTVPASLSNVVAIAAGYQHDLALKSDGTVVGWGIDAGAVVPAGLSNVVAIAAGDTHSLALRSDGTVVGWGYTSSTPYAPTNVPTGLNGVTDIVCGDFFSMALALNTPPQPIPQTLTGPLNQDSIFSLAQSVRDPNNDPLTWRIRAAPDAGTLYQYLSGGRGTAVTETNTPVSDPSVQVIFAPGLDEFGAPYTSFDVIASDGEFDSAPSLASVNIVASPVVTVVGPNQVSNGVVTLSFTGLSNANYTIRASTDLINWSFIGSASQPSPGQFQYNDFSISNLQWRFFKVRSP